MKVCSSVLLHRPQVSLANIFLRYFARPVPDRRLARAGVANSEGIRNRSPSQSSSSLMKETRVLGCWGVGEAEAEATWLLRSREV